MMQIDANRDDRSQTFRPPPSPIEINIEQLVLHGFSALDRHAIGQAIQDELTRLIGEQRLIPSHIRSKRLDHVDAGFFSVSPTDRPAMIGRQAAQAIYRGLVQ